MAYTLTDQHKEALEQDGYFFVRGVLNHHAVEEIKGEIESLLVSNLSNKQDADNSRADGKSIVGTDMFRKLAFVDQKSPAVWNNLVLSKTAIELNTYYLGDDYQSRGVFLFTKPAKIGEPTPWHQDIGLWTQSKASKANMDAYRPTTNMWVALDPANRSNGCLQVVPGSHKTEVIEHVKYDDAVHVELPRHLTENLDVFHIELEPGDALFWHSNLWHYSPKNLSESKRWGLGMIALDEENMRRIGQDSKPYILKNGEPQQFPGSASA